MVRASSTVVASATCASKPGSTTSCCTWVAISSLASSRGPRSKSDSSTWASIGPRRRGRGSRQCSRGLRRISPRASERCRVAGIDAMDSAALLIDFGSTYTKLRAVDLDRRRILGAGQGPSTVTSDIMVGMKAALLDLERRLGGLPRFRYRLASSSAAGGLRMVTVGLVRELTAEAARRAALGAGAKLVGAFAYRLTQDDIERIVALAPDILLLAGGTDGGNLDVILHNAQTLARSPLACPIVLAGNRNATDDARASFAGKVVLATENVM